MKLKLRGKDPEILWQDDSLTDDQRRAFKRLLEDCEYYALEVDIDPKTGEGTCRFVHPSRGR